MPIRTVPLALAIVLATGGSSPRSRALEDGPSLERRLHVQLTVLPSTWKLETQVMDTIWRTLGLHGVNYYAYGAAEARRPYAARSDPSSQLYQASFGVYTVAGDSAFRLATGRNYAIESMRKLADYDQRAWLWAMGDPHPFARSDTIVDMQKITIDGVERTLCLFHMQTHSDLNSGATPLAAHMGMPSKAMRQMLPPYHPLSLHEYYAFWYDAQRRATIIVYASSSSYIPVQGWGRRSPMYTDNGVGLDKQLHDMIRGVRIVDAPASH
jgi:hypothetical protein